VDAGARRAVEEATGGCGKPVEGPKDLLVAIERSLARMTRRSATRCST
jgi:hypothetical protein